MRYKQFFDEMNVFPVFSTREVEKHFPGFDSRRLVEWQGKGYIQKLRNRFYYFTGITVHDRYLFFAANVMYSPSYVSLESALSWYGFIPEGVFQVTSCSARKTQLFETPLGNFSYRNIKPALFFGYQMEQWNHHHFAIADPEKTIIDYLYLHHEIKESEDLDALRWNSTEIVNQISIDKLKKYSAHIDSKALSKKLTILREFLDVNTT